VTVWRVVTLYGRALMIAGPTLLAAALVLDPRWTGQGIGIAALALAGVGLRGVAVPLSKYSYLTQTGIVSLAGGLLLGVPATAIGLAAAVLGADWVWHRKPLSVAAVNYGRELLALVAAYGVYAWAWRAAGLDARSLGADVLPPVFFFLLAYFLASRLLFYFTLLLRAKLERHEELLILRYECIAYFGTLVATAIVVLTVRSWPPVTWLFVGPVLIGLGLLLRQILIEAIAAEELNRIHALEAALTVDVGLEEAFARTERLARRLVDWGDFRVYRLVRGEARLAYRGSAGRADRGEPSPDIVTLRVEAVRTAEPVVIADVSRDPRVADAPEAVQTLVIIPLRFGERTVGTLELEHHKRHSYRASDIVTITTFANQLATAIHIADLRRPLVDTVERLAEQVATLTRAAAGLREIAASVASSTATIRTGALSEADEVQTGLAMTDQLAELSRRMSGAGLEAARVSAEASAVAVRHRGAIREAIERLVTLKTFVSEASAQVHELGQISRRITGFIASIRDLAQMTDLLALNAAIEAARAGQHGRGFAVVAGAVRQLAEQSAAAAAEAGELVQGVHRQVAEVVEQMRRGQVTVQGVEELSAGALGALDAIVTATAGATAHAQRIATSTEEQGGAFAGLRLRMDAVAAIAGQNRAEADDVAVRAGEAARGLGELERATQELEQVAAMLRDLTHSFASAGAPS
jgi:methyl-accepting chemotaxis protein